MSSDATRILTSVQSRGALPMLMAFVRAYPGRSAAAIFAVLVAGLMDGLGMSMLLSMLSLATRKPDHQPSLPEQVATRAAEFFGLPPTAQVLLTLAIVLIGLKAVLTLLANRQVGYTVAHIATDLRLALVRAVMAARWRHYLQQSIGRLSNAVATEAQRASEAFQHGSEMAAMLLNSLIYLGIALSISWQAGVAALAAGAVLLVLLQRLIRISRRAGQHQTTLLRALVSAIGAALSAAKPLKAMAREDHVDALISDQTRQLKRAIRRQVVSKEALTALQEPLLAIMVGLGFFLSLFLLKMPLAAVLVMVFLLARVVNYLSKVQRAYQQVVVRESAYWSLIEAIAAATAQAEPRGGQAVPHLAEAIRFDDVVFGHGDSRRLLDHASFAIPAQGLTVLVGPSGAGKTTLLDLVIGLQQPESGRILIDGVPLGEIDIRQWRRLIGYVPQESVMVDDSVIYNLALGEEDVGEPEIREALLAADALAFVEAMPEGLQTRLGEGGSRLSGGQRQRLAIARALVHKPRLLILDEATSNLDAEAQAAVVETVRHLKGSLTILAVSHQDLLIEAADRIYRLAGGKIGIEPRLEDVAALPVHGDGAEPLWVLLGSRHGDNRQLLAIADALGRPYRAVPLRFGPGARLAPLGWFAHRLTWRSESPLLPPWPRAVLAAGRKSVPAALWIRRASGGQTRLIHVNRPWSPLDWFDLVVTTPQYGLPERDNVLVNLLPFVPLPAPAPLPATFAERAAALPRPWTAVLVGGDSRPFVLDEAAASGLAALVNAERRHVGGSVWVLDSPRTPAAALAVLERGLEAPVQFVRWGRDENCYQALLGLADRFVVTADSASMLTEALLSGRPVTPFALPTKADWRWRAGAAWRQAAERSPQSATRRALDHLIGLGLVSSVRDLGRLQRELTAAGLFGVAGRALALAESERARTVARINALIDRP